MMTTKITTTKNQDMHKCTSSSHPPPLPTPFISLSYKTKLCSWLPFNQRGRARISKNVTDIHFFVFHLFGVLIVCLENAHTKSIRCIVYQVNFTQQQKNKMRHYSTQTQSDSGNFPLGRLPNKNHNFIFPVDGGRENWNVKHCVQKYWDNASPLNSSARKSAHGNTA